MTEKSEFRPERLFSVHGMRVLVTGSAGQLGSNFVDALLSGGAKVIALDADNSSLRRTADERAWPPDRVVALDCDISKKSSVESAFLSAESAFDGIDAMVNNAGVSVFEPFLERPEESIDWVMDVNLKGTIFCIQEFTRHRARTGGGGQIVNVASHYGLISPDPRIYTDCDRKNSEIYGATKAGIIQMTRYFAVHLAEHKIRVNSISPGGVRNKLDPQGADFQDNYGFRCPMGRMAEVEEMVGAMVFLISDASSYVNGHNLVVDGGMSCW